MSRKTKKNTVTNCFYRHFLISNEDVLDRSPNERQFLGLNLLFLLAQNRVSEYESDLENIPLEAVHESEYIRFAIAIKQCLDESDQDRIIFASVSYCDKCTYIG